jgi:hypothetical protein
MSSWQNGELAKCQAQNDKLAKWEAGKMARCWQKWQVGKNGKLTKSQD